MRQPVHHLFPPLSHPCPLIIFQLLPLPLLPRHYQFVSRLHSTLRLLLHRSTLHVDATLTGALLPSPLWTHSSTSSSGTCNTSRVSAISLTMLSTRRQSRPLPPLSTFSCLSSDLCTRYLPPNQEAVHSRVMAVRPLVRRRLLPPQQLLRAVLPSLRHL